MDLHSVHSASSRVDTIPAGTRLLASSVVIRHGDRAPIGNIFDRDVRGALREAFWATAVLPPSDIESLNARFRVRGTGSARPPSAPRWPFGALTRRGADQSFIIGRHLRHVYGPVLTAPSNVECRSTCVSRTVRTAQCFLSGLCTSSSSWDDGEVDDAALESLAIVVEEAPEAWTIAHFNYARALVPVMIEDYNSRNAALQSTPLAAEAKTELQRALPQFRERWGRASLLHFFDALRCRHSHRCGAIAGVDEAAIADGISAGIAGVFWRTFAERHGATSNGAMVSGALLEEVAVSFAVAAAAAVPGSTAAARAASPSLRVYVGHDTTIMPLLVGLGLDSDEESGATRPWPLYSSNVRLELLALEPQEERAGVAAEASAPRDVALRVRVVYNGDVMRLPACGGVELCPLERFNALVMRARPRGWRTLARGDAAGGSPLAEAADAGRNDQ